MEQNLNLNQQLLTKLRERLPAEAIKPHPTKTYLSQINSIYVVERLNDVFGLGSWGIDHQVIERRDAHIRTAIRKGNRIEEFLETTIVVKACFWALIPEQYGGGTIKLEAFGGNDNDDLGDAYKGACTDALTKIGSFLGIGAHVWKDKKGAAPQPQARPQAQDNPPATVQANPSGGTPTAQNWLNPNSPKWAGFVKATALAMAQGGMKIVAIYDKIRDEHGLALSKQSREVFERDVELMIAQMEKQKEGQV